MLTETRGNSVSSSCSCSLRFLIERSLKRQKQHTNLNGFNTETWNQEEFWRRYVQRRQIKMSILFLCYFLNCILIWLPPSSWSGKILFAQQIVKLFAPISSAWCLLSGRVSQVQLIAAFGIAVDRVGFNFKWYFLIDGKINDFY